VDRRVRVCCASGVGRQLAARPGHPATLAACSHLQVSFELRALLQAAQRCLRHLTLSPTWPPLFFLRLSLPCRPDQARRRAVRWVGLDWPGSQKIRWVGESMHSRLSVALVHCSWLGRSPRESCPSRHCRSSSKAGVAAAPPTDAQPIGPTAAAAAVARLLARRGDAGHLGGVWPASRAAPAAARNQVLGMLGQADWQHRQAGECVVGGCQERAGCHRAATCSWTLPAAPAGSGRLLRQISTGLLLRLLLLHRHTAATVGRRRLRARDSKAPADCNAQTEVVNATHGEEEPHSDRSVVSRRAAATSLQSSTT
jgi:hypothetical protein